MIKNSVQSSYRLSEEQKQQIEAMAYLANCESPSAYLRALVTHLSSVVNGRKFDVRQLHLSNTIVEL